MQAVFPNHAYGLPVGGTKADVEKFQVEQVQKYYRDFYSPDNAVLVIVGDFQTANTLETVKEVFGELAKRVRSELAVSVAEWELGVTFIPACWRACIAAAFFAGGTPAITSVRS